MAGHRAAGQRLLLAEGTRRTSGRDARTMNITAAKAITEAVRTTLGPKGMDKMLVDSSGNVVITNDGVTILSEMDIEHPAANMIVEVAETQEEEVGDGTTTAVVLAGALLKQSEELVAQDIHPTTVANGYRRANERAREILADRATSVDVDDVETLEQIAATVMTGKSAEDARDHLAEIVVKAIQSVAEDDFVDLENVTIETAVGGPIEDTELVDGILVDEDPVSGDMPRRVSDAAIALLSTGIEVQETEIDAEIAVEDPERLREFQEAERESILSRVDQVIDAGANVVFTGEDIAPAAVTRLTEAGVLAIEDVDDEDLTRLARVTGGRVATTVDDITPDTLGAAGEVYVDEVGEDEPVFVAEVGGSDVVTIILRGGTEGAVAEVERALQDSLHAVRAAIESGQLLPGGGASETELSLALRKFADSVGGREQLAVEAFADALEIVPRTLAENAGIDPIDALVSLRERHDAGEWAAGLDVATGDVADMSANGVVEPLPVKQLAVDSATEAAVMILRIDDVISAD